MRLFHSLFTTLLLLIGLSAAATPIVGYCNSVLSFTFNSYQVTIPEYNKKDYRCILKPKTKGAAVKNLQTHLNKCYARKLDLDGQYGDKTKAAVKYMQKASKVTADGVYGPKTAQKMKFWGKKGSGGACKTAAGWSRT